MPMHEQHGGRFVNTMARTMLKQGTSRRRRPLPKGKQKRASAKISKLAHEGVPPQQRIATALNMARKNRLGPQGGYKRVGR